MVDLNTEKKACSPLAEHLLCNEELPPRHDKFRCLIHDRLECILNSVKLLNTYIGKSEPVDPNQDEAPQALLADRLPLEVFLLEAPGCINETCRMIRNELEVFATRVFGYSSFLDIYSDKCEASNSAALRHAELIISYNYIADLEIIIHILMEMFFQNNSNDIQNQDRVREEREIRFPNDLHFTAIFCPETKYNLDQIFDKCDDMLYRISVRIVESPEPEEAPTP